MNVRPAEPRQITIVLCDVVDWTLLAQQTDPEDLAETAQQYRRRCAAIVMKHGGVVAQYLGDGVLAYFGYPHAHEDAAERAVRAALEIAAAEAASPSALRVHIGIATGDVVVGAFDETSGAPTHGLARTSADVAAFGQAPNLAARLQAVAPPGSVVVSDQTRRLCRGVFDYRNLGRLQLKGFVEPVQAWQVLGESRSPSRFHALRADALTPLVDRREELDEIARLWTAARAGSGSTLLVSGEPGVGKSRLVDEASRQIVSSGCLRLRYFCSSHLQGSPLAPLIRQLPRVAGFTNDDDAATKIVKLRRFSGATSLDPAEIVPFLATLLAIPCEGAYLPSSMTPQRQRQRLFELLLELLKSAASIRPILFVVEDLHWIDPSSDELVGLVVEASVHLPVLVLITTRPEYQPHWRGRAHREMKLSPLDRHDSLLMIESLCRDVSIPDRTMAAIADRSDGLPLFIEDVTRDVLEHSEGPQLPGRQSGAQKLADRIPATLQDALMSRLDRTGSAKEIAQVGAALGREFSYRLLSRVVLRDEEVLKDEIHRLVASGLLEPRPSATIPTYAFKHALVCDAAYSSLLRKDRRALHARIAAALLNDFADVVDAQPEIAAYHLQMAGDVSRAVPLWIDAARLSARRSGFVEAIAQLEGALRLLETQVEDEARQQLELRVHMVLGGIYAEYRGFSSAECGRAYGHALGLCRRLGHPPQLFAALAGLGSFEITRGHLAQSRALAEECLALAAHQASRPPFVMGHLLLGGTLFLNGEFLPARRHLDEAVRLYEEDRALRKKKQVMYVQDQKATALCYLALMMTIMGHLDAGLEAARDGVRHSRSLGGPHALNFSLCYLAGVHHIRREPTEAFRYASESLQLAREQGFATWQGISQMLRGQAAMDAGAREKGMGDIVAGLAVHSAIDAMSYHTFTTSVLARGLLAAGQPDRALPALDDAIAAGRQRGERFYLAELLRLKGEAWALTGHPLDAEHSLREAAAIAREQHARLFELRSAVSLCKLLHADQRDAAVRDLLTPVWQWFGREIESRDLTDASELLSS